jgi:N-sulfoglucosamine sulfohydrolase
MPGKNILLLIADDLGKYVGAYGCPSVNTPSLDKLAAQGTRFDSAFASTASCSGSRSTLYTGLHTHENGQYGLNIFRTHFQTFPHVESAPLLFNHAGYRTGIIGKIHVGPDAVYPWEHREESETRDVAWVADRAEAFFAAERDRPFFLTVGYVDPHRDITTRGRFGNEAEYDPRVTKIEVNPEDVEVPDWLTDLPETRQELAEYYKAIHRTDLGIGMVLDALERQGLADDTLVVFLSDNGPPFINAKTTLYDAGTCLPLLVRRPGAQAGIANPNMVSWADILPTFLDWAGLPPDYSTRSGGGSSHQVPGGGYGEEDTSLRSPPRLGRSFLPVLERSDVLPESEWQHHVFGSHTFHELHNYWPTRVLRSRRYKYHRNIAWRLDFPFASDLYASYTFEGIRNSPNPVIGSRSLKNYLFRLAEELFDLETDPDEVHNLASDPAHAEVLADIRLKLEQWQQATHDPWLVRDGCSLEMVARYGKDGLVLPDRFDIDADKPGLDGVPVLQNIENPTLQKIST